jgi:hypothetical protein
VAVATCAAPAIADDSFTLHNDIARPMRALYVAPSSSDNWGPNILDGVVAAGKDVKVSWTHGETECNWDVRGEFDDGSYAEVKDVDFCTVDEVTFHE